MSDRINHGDAMAAMYDYAIDQLDQRGEIISKKELARWYAMADDRVDENDREQLKDSELMADAYDALEMVKEDRRDD